MELPKETRAPGSTCLQRETLRSSNADIFANVSLFCFQTKDLFVAGI